MKIIDKLRLKYKCFMKKHKIMNQFCKSCGKDMSIDFHVSDEIWEKLPKKYHNHVLCLDCFCKIYSKNNHEDIMVKIYFPNSEKLDYVWVSL